MLPKYVFKLQIWFNSEKWEINEHVLESYWILKREFWKVRNN